MESGVICRKIVGGDAEHLLLADGPELDVSVPLVWNVVNVNPRWSAPQSPRQVGV